MNLNMLAAAIAWVTFGISAVIGCTATLFGPGDSPVSIGDGSIYGRVGIFNLNTWTELKSGKSYEARSTNNDYIDLQGFSDPETGRPSPRALQDTGGWLIVISNTEPDKTRLGPKSISFCSHLSDSSSSCQAAPPIDGQVVYLQAGDRARWDRPWYYLHKKLVFHDTRDNCDKDTDDQGNCDHISQIRITTVNTSHGLPGPGGITYNCPVQDKCYVTVGK